MKTRIACALAALMSVCLLARFIPSNLGLAGPAAGARQPRGNKAASPLRDLRYLRNQWVGIVLTARSAFYYLLEPETPDANYGLVASNGASTTLFWPGCSLPPAPGSAQSNFPLFGCFTLDGHCDGRRQFLPAEREM